MSVAASPFHVDTRVPSRYQGVVFDLDGVLLDTERLCLEVETELCAQHGVEYLAADRAAILGLDVARACSYLADRFGLPARAAAELEQRYEELLGAAIEREAEPLPGAAELVAALSSANVALAVCSNSRRAVVVQGLATTGLLASFRAIVAADDVHSPKPAADPYLLACRLLEVPPARALALEDSSIGLRAAVAAGLDCWVVGDQPVEARGTVRRVNSLLELVST